MIKYNIPDRRNAKLDFNAFKNQSEAVRKHDNLRFNPFDFYVMSNNTGEYVSLQNKEAKKVTSDFEISNIEVTDDNLIIQIYGGTILIGITEITCADTILTLTTQKSYVGWEYSYSAETLSLVNFGSTLAYDDNYIRKCLYLFEKSTGSNTPELKRIKYNSQVYPANFSV